MSSIDKDYKDYLEEQEELRIKLNEVEANLNRTRRIASALSVATAGTLLVITLATLFGPTLLALYSNYLAVYVLESWLNILIVPIAGLVGFGLYQFKKSARMYYGILETILGLAAAWFAVSKVATAGFAEGITLVAAIYFIVRGIDNIYTSIEELKAKRTQELLDKVPPIRPHLTFEEVKRALDNPNGPEMVRRRYGG